MDLFNVTCPGKAWDNNGMLENECFQNTLMVWIPCGWLWLSLIGYIPYLHCQTTYPSRTSRVCAAKMILSASLLSIYMAKIMLMFFDEGDLPLNKFITNIIMFSTLILSMSLQMVEWEKRFVTSGVNFIFSFLAFFTTAIFFLKREDDTLRSRIINLSDLIVKFVLIIAFSIADRPPHDGLTTVEKSSFLSRITFSWMTRFMIKGYRQRLNEREVPGLLATEQSELLHKKFKQTQQKMSHQNMKLAETPSTEKTVSLIRVLIRMYWKEMVVTFILRLFYDLLLFFNPVLLSKFLVYMSSSSKDIADGWIYSLLFFLVNLLQILLDQTVFARGWKTSINVSTTLMTLIYDKVQKIGIQDVDVVTYLSTDVNMFREMIPYTFILWSGPFQTIICSAILFYYIGRTAAFTFLIIPIIFMFFIIGKQIENVLNQYTDLKEDRVRLLKEMILYIKSVKLFAQEKLYLKKLQKIREQEMDRLKKTVYYESIISALGEISPQWITLLIFFVHEGNSINVGDVFITLMALGFLECNMSMYSDCVSDIVKAKESYKKIVEFLNQEDNSFKPDEQIPDDAVYVHDSLNITAKDVARQSDLIYSIVITDATFKDECLKNINLKIKTGELVAVCGGPSSGKSTLLYALLGQLKKESGKVCRVGKVAYTPQEPWVINDTLKMNILFGKHFHKKHFQQALKYCHLDGDIDEDTMITDQGSNLSGGQLYRINLARAVYSRPNIFLLDNPLCALDATTARYIYDNLLGEKGLLKNIARIIVTQPTAHWLPEADKIIVMESNTIAECGTFKELQMMKGKFVELLQQCPQNKKQAPTEEEMKRHGIFTRSISIFSKLLPKTRQSEGGAAQLWRSMTSRFKTKSHVKKSGATPSQSFRCQLSRRVYMNQRSLKNAQLKTKDLSTEDSDFRVSGGVFRKYLKSIGKWALMASILLGMLFEAFRTFANYQFESMRDHQNSTEYKTHYLKNSSLLSFFAGIFLILFGVLSTFFLAKASCKIHHTMAENIFNRPLKYFETTDQGCIMQPFNDVLYDVDSQLPNLFMMWIKDFLRIIVTAVLLCRGLKLNSLFLLVIVAIILLISHVFVRATSVLQHFTNEFQCSLYTHFLETESGSQLIQAYNNEEIFLEKAYKCIDNYQKFFWSVIAAKRWAGFWLQFIGCFIILITCLIFVYGEDNSTVGLTLTYLIATVKCFEWVVRTASDIAIKRVSLNQIQEFNKLITVISGNTRENWPCEGRIDILNYSASYSDGQQNCLNDINICIQPKEKVGIVGKSGSGKSSLMMAITRLINRVGGRILIDDVDIETMNPLFLRSNLTIFPQTTNLFTGDLGSNLDPEGKFQDEELTKVLSEVNLGDKKLDEPCYDFGAGDKQLVGLAKCILNKTKVLILDECTANVSATQQQQIQDIIEEKFKDCTVLNIVHKLEMVQKYDKILVMEKGEVKNFDRPEAASIRSMFFKNN